MDESNEFQNMGSLEVEKPSAETVGANDRVPVRDEYLIGQQNSQTAPTPEVIPSLFESDEEAKRAA
ncbi:MAG TPA: hypothetical protein VFX22_05950, partial [Candidatus Kapabacteria bacterium]|nr:hypothetical protein [Candidatus Kapabacteria bacterium]